MKKKLTTKCTKRPLNTYTKWSLKCQMAKNIPKSSIPRPDKAYHNLNFWFVKIYYLATL
jgi:hypothetical protein